MKSRRPTLLPAVLVLLLCLLSVGAWGRSYLPQHLVVRSEQGRLILVFWEGDGPGQSLFDRDTGAGPGGVELWRRLLRSTRDRRGPHFESLGFGTVGGNLHPFALRLVSIPWWSMTLLTAVASAALAARALRHRGRLHSGRCINCGYDLRATPGRCPECGDAPERLTAAAAAATTTTARAGESGEALRPPLGITVGTDEQILGILNGGGLRSRPPRR